MSTKYSAIVRYRASEKADVLIEQAVDCGMGSPGEFYMTSGLLIRSKYADPQDKGETFEEFSGSIYCHKFDV